MCASPRIAPSTSPEIACPRRVSSVCRGRTPRYDFKCLRNSDCVMRASNKDAPAGMFREGLPIFFDNFTLSHFQVCIKGNSEELRGTMRSSCGFSNRSRRLACPAGVFAVPHVALRKGRLSADVARRIIHGAAVSRPADRDAVLLCFPVAHGHPLLSCRILSTTSRARSCILRSQRLV